MSLRGFLLRYSRFLSRVLILFLAGCSSEYYRRDADEEVYTILKDKQQTVFGKSVPFSLADYGGRPEVVGDVLKLNLRDALTLAYRHSREFQNMRESLYRIALTLTARRHEYAPTFLSSIQGALSGNKDATTGSVNGSPTLGFNKLWKWGLFLPVRFSNNLLRSFTSNPAEVASSTLSASISQPILRGFGSKIFAENLTQSERDVIYEVRSFERYRRTFAVQITGSYLQALQGYDAVENAHANLRNLELSFQQVREEAKWGRVEKFQLDQTETSYLAAQENVNDTEKSLQDTLDRFKMELGLPLQQKIALDVADLGRLNALGFERLGLSTQEAAQEIALNARLDLANQRDSVDDAQRQVVIMEDQLRVQLDLDSEINVHSEPTQPGVLKFEDFDYRAGVTLNLPLDRKNERNNYRSSLISLAQSKRALEEDEDRIRLDVISSIRSLEKTKYSHDIQLKSRNLAKQRVESTQVLRRYGQVQMRDLLEAQQEELRAENDLTRAVIDNHVAYLNCLLALGVLEVDQDGVYKEFALEEASEKALEEEQEAHEAETKPDS